MPTEKLTIRSLLQKNFPSRVYGSVTANAKLLECTEKQFSRWYSGATKPSSDTTIELLRKMKMLKNNKPDQPTK